MYFKLILSFLFMVLMLIGIIFSIVGIKLIGYYISKYYNEKINENIKNKIRKINNIIMKIGNTINIIIEMLIFIIIVGVLTFIGYAILFPK